MPSSRRTVSPGRTRAPFHLLRAGSMALAMLALALAAHAFAGGVLPAPPLLAAILALVMLTSVLATRVRLRLPALTVLLGAGQLALHEALSTLGSAPAAGTGPAPAALHQHDGAALAAALQHLPSGMAAHAEGSHSTLMILAHTAATALMALLLARGEAALWALAGWLRPLFRLLIARAPVPFRAPEAPQESPLPRLPWRTLRRDRLRGPPRDVVVAF